MVGGDTVVKTTYTSYDLLPPPEKFEAGLQDYAGIMGLGAAVQFIESVGLDAIHQHELELNTHLTRALEEVDQIRLIGPQDPQLRGGIYSFNIVGVDPHQVALMLDETARIMVRSGQHCVHSWFDAHHLTGSARASFYFYNTADEVDLFVNQLKTVMTVLS
jgi:cysteine desulfurase/selenocysteine lyase